MQAVSTRRVRGLPFAAAACGRRDLPRVADPCHGRFHQVTWSHASNQLRLRLYSPTVPEALLEPRKDCPISLHRVRETAHNASTLDAGRWESPAMLTRG